MRLETIPLILGGLTAVVGILFLVDAWAPDAPAGVAERRRRIRAERHRGGEAMLGAGLVAASVTLLGLDRWRWGTVAAIAGVVLLAIGAWLNRRFLAELLLTRGAARRRRTGARRTGSRRRDTDRPFRIR